MHYVTGCMRMPSPPHGMIAVSGLLISWLPLPVSHVTHEEHGNGVMHCKPSINNPHPPAPLERVTAPFKDSYGIIPIVIASAPGRVNLIREHLDYNGDVLPFATARRTWVAVAPPTPLRWLARRSVISPFTERMALPRATGATTHWRGARAPERE
jgi:hypothetical protein